MALSMISVANHMLLYMNNSFLKVSIACWVLTLQYVGYNLMWCHCQVRPTFINTLFPVHCLHLFLATGSKFIMELIFEILTNTPIISELHPYFGMLVTSWMFLHTKESDVLYWHKIFILYLVRLSDSVNLVVLVQLLIAFRK